MKLITREQFAELLGITKGATFKHSNFPLPCKKIPRGGPHIPMWSLDTAKTYKAARDAKAAEITARKAKKAGRTITQQIELIHEPLKHWFNIYLFAHVKSIKSLG